MRRLGAVLLGDGLVALPASDRNVEHLEWLAASIEEQGGVASTWLARPRIDATAARLAAEARDAIEAEYRAVVREVEQLARNTSDVARRRAVRRLRAELRRIDNRDYFEAPSSTGAHAAVEGLAAVARVQPLRPARSRADVLRVVAP